MPHAFISHSNADSDLAQRVAVGVESNGAPCWIAPRDIPPAGDYADALEAGVTQAKVVVFLVSEHSIASRFCRAELEIARTDEIPILPVRLDKTPISGGWRIYLSGHQYLVADGNEDAWIADLAIALRRLGVVENDDPLTSSPASQDTAGATEALLQRFEAFDPTTQARPLLSHMVATGWTPHLPQARSASAAPPSYIRLTRVGARRATAYLNSASLFVAGKAERVVLAPVLGAVDQKSGVYLDHAPSRGGSLEAGIAGADCLAEWAGGSN
ncbi:MAG: toll/interleukin-1 receptor domain-containing protein [Aquihabitans sp.]